MSKWTDIEMVDAVQHRDNVRLERMYRDCKTYFTTHAMAFFVSDTNVDDVFQESLVHLWREIETHRIEVADGRLCRWVNGECRPMTSSLLTFLLAIAKRKHWEQLRKDHLVLTDNDRTLEIMDHERYEMLPEGVGETEVRERVVADAVLGMTQRCREILTLFYYEHRSLDEILTMRAENQSKIGLKTSKYKCMQRLRQTVYDRFRQLGLHVN